MLISFHSVQKAVNSRVIQLLTFMLFVLIFLTTCTGETKLADATETTIKKTEYKNHLAGESSPYLLQHVHNPVDWYPWGDEAFEKARLEDKPIFLSIGYSTCHWCHVMAHESFEDDEVAELMNDTFVCIKVDREERPDIDNVYMTVCQMMTGSGGWPLTIIMTPDKKPFFAATYIPKNDSRGRTGMMKLVPQIKQFWENDRDAAEESADKAVSVLQNVFNTPSGDAPGSEIFKKAYDNFDVIFDSKHGGFGAAPKFPSPHNLLFLLNYYIRTGEKRSLEMVETTLTRMRNGGIFDHVGFGFHRYSTDATWLVPHFEKMLYDQALLAMSYTAAFQITEKEMYKRTVDEIFTYVLRDLTSPDGAFYSAEDADSEGVEGKFYVWDFDEMSQIVSDDAQIFTAAFDVHEDGNFYDEATGKYTGENIPHLVKTPEEISLKFKISESEVIKKLESARVKLFKVREKRIRPGLDDKVLTDWNALMISALAKASQAFNSPEYLSHALKATDFILQNMLDDAGNFYHTSNSEGKGISAHADDYAYFIQALIDMYESTFDVNYLKTALKLNEDFVSQFWDETNLGFFFTSSNAEELIVRTRESYDGARPSANSVAALNLVRLARMTSDTELEKRAEEISKAFANQINESPSAHTYFLTAIDFMVGGSYEIVIAGDAGSDDTALMVDALMREYIPYKVVLFKPEGDSGKKLVELSEFTKYQSAIDGKATAYVCQNFACNEPVTDVTKMLKLLSLSTE